MFVMSSRPLLAAHNILKHWQALRIPGPGPLSSSALHICVRWWTSAGVAPLWGWETKSWTAGAPAMRWVTKRVVWRPCCWRGPRGLGALLMEVPNPWNVQVFVLSSTILALAASPSSAVASLNATSSRKFSAGACLPTDACPKPDKQWCAGVGLSNRTQKREMLGWLDPIMQKWLVRHLRLSWVTCRNCRRATEGPWCTSCGTWCVESYESRQVGHWDVRVRRFSQCASHVDLVANRLRCNCPTHHILEDTGTVLCGERHAPLALDKCNRCKGPWSEIRQIAWLFLNSTAPNRSRSL